MTSSNLLEMEHVFKEWEDGCGIKDISLTLSPGDMLGIYGRNGSGKSTLLRVISGTLMPDQGKGHCMGEEMFLDSQTIKKKIAYIPQGSSLYNELTVRDNLTFFARVYGLKKPRTRVDDLLDILSLNHEADKKVGFLSGGWRQRVQIAICLLHDPSLIILDEPMDALDASSRSEIWTLLRECASLKKAIIVVTHEFREQIYFNKLLLIKNSMSLFFGKKQLLTDQFMITGLHFKGRPLRETVSILRNFKQDLYLIFSSSGVKVISDDLDMLTKLREKFEKEYAIEKLKIGMEECIEYLCLS